MDKVKIIRSETGPSGTFGILLHNGQSRFVTLEPEWRDNQQDVSCIPHGVYRCKPFKSPTKGNVFVVENVPGREDIQFHIGNFEDDTQGCILVGRWFYEFAGNNRGIAMSKQAFTKFRELLSDKPFELEIVNCF